MGGDPQRVKRLVLALLLAAAAGMAAGEPAPIPPPPDVDFCGACHQDAAVKYAAPGGHAAALDCIACHGDRRPGRVGRRHRTIPDCQSCHAGVQAHPPKAARRRGRRATRACLSCHDPHGATNLDLVRDLVRSRARLLPATFLVAAAGVPGGFTDATDPGAGICERCHRRTDVYRADGTGAPHFTQDCVSCHDHTAGFAAVASDANCATCHADQAARLAKASGHSNRACGSCHPEVAPTPGPGHRAAEACGSCHPNTATHAPHESRFACTQCHDPHGSDNTDLVLAAITTPQGSERPVVFRDRIGRADGSFASASTPGTGVCEICHTSTRFYRVDGGGEPHFTFSCLPCHLHANGFAPGAGAP